MLLGSGSVTGPLHVGLEILLTPSGVDEQDLGRIARRAKEFDVNLMVACVDVIWSSSCGERFGA
jgi:hypothetical protein